MEELISKKELLALTKISYGQLYRWKRMNMIPEDWFIKKSTTTGQETFFERDKILKRIHFILSNKDEASLEDIAELLNEKEGRELYRVAVGEKESLHPSTMEVFYNITSTEQEVGLKELFIIALIEKYLIPSYITMEELKLMQSLVEKEFQRLYNSKGKLYLFRKLGVSIVAASSEANEIFIDEATIRILEVSIEEEIINTKVMFDKITQA